jgi:phosphatidylserine/phosphatidylglycerophosphate/cardiolipin synthase-like enzyme
LISGLILAGKKVEICTADNLSNRARRSEFSSWHWKLIKKPYIHAKVIIVDQARVFIGSHNLTTNAIENNREMGIILDSRGDIVKQIQGDFIRDGCR